MQTYTHKLSAMSHAEHVEWSGNLNISGGCDPCSFRLSRFNTSTPLKISEASWEQTLSCKASMLDELCSSPCTKLAVIQKQWPGKHKLLWIPKMKTCLHVNARHVEHTRHSMLRPLQNARSVKTYNPTHLRDTAGSKLLAYTINASCYKLQWASLIRNMYALSCNQSVGFKTFLDSNMAISNEPGHMDAPSFSKWRKQGQSQKDTIGSLHCVESCRKQKLLICTFQAWRLSWKL